LATCAQGTKRFVPESDQPLGVFSARADIVPGSQSRSASSSANVARASPVAIAESQRFFWVSVPAVSTAAAASTVGQ